MLATGPPVWVHVSLQFDCLLDAGLAVWITFDLVKQTANHMLAMLRKETNEWTGLKKNAQAGKHRGVCNCAVAYVAFAIDVWSCHLCNDCPKLFIVVCAFYMNPSCVDVNRSHRFGRFMLSNHGKRKPKAQEQVGTQARLQRNTREKRV